MSVYRDTSRGTIQWRYRKTVRLRDGAKVRISGTPDINTKHEAENAERDHVKRTIDPPPPPAIDPVAVQTIKDYSKTFLDTYAAEHKPSERRSKAQILNGHILPKLGHLRLDELRQEHVDAFAATERKRCAVKTVNNRLTVLSSLVKYAVDNGVIAAPRPRLRFKKPGMVGEIEAVTAVDVEKLLEKAAGSDLRLVVLLAAEAGLRAGEIRGLQHGDIRDGQLTVRRAIDKDSAEVISPKHDRIRTVPLSPRLAAELEGRPRKGLWVLCRKDGGALAYNALVADVIDLYAAAEVTKPPKPLHCLRHAFGTTMAGRNTPLAVLQALMGHADIKTTMRYVDVNEDQKRAAIAAVFASSSGLTGTGGEGCQPAANEVAGADEGAR